MSQKLWVWNLEYYKYGNRVLYTYGILEMCSSLYQNQLVPKYLNFGRITYSMWACTWGSNTLGVASYCGEVMILALSEITLIVIGEPPSTLCEMRNKLCNTYPSFQLTLPAACRFSVVVPLHLPSLFYLLIFQNGTIQAASFIIPWFAYFSYLWEPIFMIQNLASGYTCMYIHTYIHLHLSYMYDQFAAWVHLAMKG